jgi:hypothetical protein
MCIYSAPRMMTSLFFRFVFSVTLILTIPLIADAMFTLSRMFYESILSFSHVAAIAMSMSYMVRLLQMFIVYAVPVVKYDSNVKSTIAPPAVVYPRYKETRDVLGVIPQQPEDMTTMFTNDLPEGMRSSAPTWTGTPARSSMDNVSTGEMLTSINAMLVSGVPTTPTIPNGGFRRFFTHE